MKRGQLQMSFGMIFSIILIVAIVGISAYFLINFLRLGKCTEVGLFYNDLEVEVEKGWKSTIYSKNFESAKLPSEIEMVCFGDLNQGYSGEYEEEFDFLYRYRSQDKNLFLYPPQEACNINLAYFNLEHVAIEDFFCVEPVNGKIKVSMEKNQFDAVVNLKK
jgi:hypothetical protein